MNPNRKLIVIVQCESVLKRCSGTNCAAAFYSRTGLFADTPAEDVLYLTMPCGGCGGTSISPKLENLRNRLHKLDVSPENVTIHLASCLVSDNHHRGPCPFRGAIKSSLIRHGFDKIVSGTYISKKTQQKREAGIYRPLA